MPKVTQAHTDARKNQILDGAAACFARKGFHQTTMQDICAGAGLSPGAVYSYFKSKEDIITRIALGALKRNLGLIANIEQHTTTRDKLNELADVFFKMLDNPEDFHIRTDIELWGEALRSDKIMELRLQSFKSHEQIFAQIIAQGQENGEIVKDVDPESVARVMISMYDGLLLQKGFNENVDVWSYVAVLKKMIEGLYCDER